MLDPRRIILEANPDAICLLHNVTVSHDVALGVDDDAGTQGTLADAAAITTRAALAAEKLVKEIFKGIVVIARALTLALALTGTSAAAMRVLNG